MHRYFTSGVIILVAAILIHFLGITKLLLLTSQIGLIVVAGILGAVVALRTGRQRTWRDFSAPQFGFISHSMSKTPLYRPKRLQPSLKSRVLDKAIHELLELLLRDYLLTWYNDIGKDQEGLKRQLLENLLFAIEKLAERGSAVDWVKLLMDDTVVRLTRHFQDMKNFHNSLPPPGSDVAGFVAHPCIKSEAAEITFLRHASDVLLFTLLPESHVQCSSMRGLLRELIVFKVLRPLVDGLCDPDYINQTLLNYLTYRESLSKKANMPGSGYRYAATYEDFIKFITECRDRAQLEGIRYHVISEIMLITAALNFYSSSKSMSAEERQALESLVLSRDRFARMKDRNLKRYFNNCQVAMSHCDKRLKFLGGAAEEEAAGSSKKRASFSKNPSKAAARRQTGNVRMMTFKEVMETESAFAQFIQFLQRKGSAAPLFFVASVEELKLVDMADLPPMAKSVYDSHLRADAPDYVEIDKQLLRDIEGYIQGTQGPNGLFGALDQVLDFVHKEHYEDFLLSDLYYTYITAEGAEEKEDPTSLTAQAQIMSTSPQTGYDYGRASLEVKKDLLRVKQAELVEAQHGTKTTVASPSYIRMEQEVETMRHDIQVLETHLERQDLWFERMGNWHVQVDCAEMTNDKGKMVPLMTLMVSRSVGVDRPNSPPASTDEEKALREGEEEGWVVHRFLTEFQQLHRALRVGASRVLSTDVLMKDLPVPGKSIFRQVEEEYLRKLCRSLQSYLQALLTDEILQSSEELYRFLCRGMVDEQRKPSSGDSSSSFSITSLLKSLPVVGGGDEEDEDGLGLDETDGREQKDSIAEPLYVLVSELFELHGVFKWLRRQLMVFVQVTFGGTINKQLRQTVQWLRSEEMLVYYLHNFRDSWWPNGQLAAVWPTRSDEEKAQTKLEAKEKLLKNIPEVLASFVGQKNSRIGATKIFEGFQDARANKQLFYIMFELAMFSLFPELKSQNVINSAGEA
ncbi:sorting nexin-25-like isoform X1 [Sycon ciliatum]|uniref:sorting nexin-25-like isoform X1 n=1 Tax=Sycon ciliatum TaxID=27933 RepID=UPI0031F703AA